MSSLSRDNNYLGGRLLSVVLSFLLSVALSFLLSETDVALGARLRKDFNPLKKPSRGAGAACNALAGIAVLTTAGAPLKLNATGFLACSRT